jgi:hypothetical protein
MNVFTLPPKLRAVTHNHPETVTGYYVYVWLSDEQIFYIGYGKGRKAWNLHNEEAESTKFIARDFQVQIIRDNIPKNLAQLIKATLIKEFRSKGYKLCNAR